LFQPGKQETGNKEALKKVERNYGSLNIQAETIEENGDQTENVICTYYKGKFSDKQQGEIIVQ
jgi:hypothetical protein